MSVTVRDGATVTQDPSDALVYEFDWDTENLGSSVTIVTSAFTATQISGPTAPAIVASDASPLGIQAGSRTTKVLVSGGSVGARYRVSNTIVTNENPAQTKDRSFFLKVEER